ncbi:hypothetical protein LOK49_LG01G02054 [Camellia lanceoleosa]|uniref:Uncharacterized protein n=1 Tax=Camellia lanceoleosa TaxID=1840588 RepID=A0ACC0IXL6_9ERIC|nr:hypothetical protein LOK49_LG01G02054 [Camellia lanceoleosa]
MSKPRGWSRSAPAPMYFILHRQLAWYSWQSCLCPGWFAGCFQFVCRDRSRWFNAGCWGYLTFSAYVVCCRQCRVSGSGAIWYCYACFG